MTSALSPRAANGACAVPRFSLAPFLRGKGDGISDVIARKFPALFCAVPRASPNTRESAVTRYLADALTRNPLGLSQTADQKKPERTYDLCTVGQRVNSQAVTLLRARAQTKQLRLGWGELALRPCHFPCRFFADVRRVLLNAHLLSFSFHFFVRCLPFVVMFLCADRRPTVALCTQSSSVGFRW